MKIQSNSVYPACTDNSLHFQHFYCLMEIRARILFNFFLLCNIWRCVIFTMLAIVLHFNSHFRCYVSIKLNSDAKKHEQIRKNENSLSSFYGVIFFFFSFARQGKVPSFFTICIRFYGKSPLNQSPYHSIPTNDPNHSDFSSIVSTIYGIK